MAVCAQVAAYIAESAPYVVMLAAFMTAVVVREARLTAAARGWAVRRPAGAVPAFRPLAVTTG